MGAGWLEDSMGSGRYGRLAGLARLVRLGRWLSLVALIAGLGAADGVAAQPGSLGGTIGSTQGPVTVACETKDSRVFFPYEDLRMPCEQKIVRTFTTNGDIVDTGQGNQPGMVAVFESVQDGKANGIDPAGQQEQRAQREGERREN